MKLFRTILVASSVFTLSFSGVSQAAPQEAYTGFTDMTGTYNGKPMGIKIWYPTDTPSRMTGFGYFKMLVAQDAPIKKGMYGLAIVSHGDGGSDLGHRNIGLLLSRHGYIVVSVMHPNNNYRQNTHSRVTENWINRPKHISTALDMIEKSQFNPYVDKNKVVMIGYSAGAYTAVASIGGKADTANIAKHCSKNAKTDVDFCRTVVGDDQGLPGSLLGTSRLPKVDNHPPVIIHNKEKRFKASIVMAPMAVQFYGQGTLDDIDIPVLLLSAEKDEVLPRPFHAEYIAKNLKGAIYEVMPGAGHYAFITPFPPELEGQVEGADEDPPGFDRTAFQRELDARILKFLNSVFQQ